MGKSPKSKSAPRRKLSPHPSPQQDDYGRDTETTKVGTTVVADVKGGSGHRGDDDDDPGWRWRPPSKARHDGK